MSKQQQTIEVQYSTENYGIIRNQDVTNIVIDEEGYAFGYWNKKLVGAFSIKCDKWFVM